jgi:hypothetical protein
MLSEECDYKVLTNVFKRYDNFEVVFKHIPEILDLHLQSHMSQAILPIGSVT